MAAPDAVAAAAEAVAAELEGAPLSLIQTMQQQMCCRIDGLETTQ